MKIIKLILLVLLVGLVSGCGTMSFKPEMISETEAFKYDNMYMAEYEAMKQAIQDTEIVKWIQPANKTEGSKIFVGTSSMDDRTLKPDYRIYWDGESKDGYAYGLGREFEKGFLTDMEAIALYSGNKEEEPQYYYQKNKLKNQTVAGDLNNGYVVMTDIKDDPLNFFIEFQYGKIGGDFPRIGIMSTPLHGNVVYRKQYLNFEYFILDMSNNNDEAAATRFQIIDAKTGEANGFCIQKMKDGSRITIEQIDGVRKRFVELPQSYYDHAQKIYDEIIQAGQKAIDAQTTALQVKQQYKQKICSDNASINFMDNAEYRAICEEDKYMADIKIKLDRELEKIAAAKAQERTLQAREMEAMAAQRQAVAAQQQADAVNRQADAAESANAMQFIHNIDMDNQMQQLNNNLFMMNRTMNRNPQQIYITPNTGIPRYRHIRLRP